MWGCSVLSRVSVGPCGGCSLENLGARREETAGGEEPVSLVQVEEWTFLVLGQKPRRLPGHKARAAGPGTLEIPAAYPVAPSPTGCTCSSGNWAGLEGREEGRAWMPAGPGPHFVHITR